MSKSTRSSRARLGSNPILTVRGTITTSGQSLEHVQYITDVLVVTELGGAVVLHSTELGGRFVVDRTARVLRRVDPSSQIVQVGHLKELVGEVSVHRDPVIREIDGYECRRYRLCNDSGKIVVSADAYCARFEVIGRSALQNERRFEAELHPFALPLEPDELVIRSTTRTFANGFQHTQSYQHESMTEGIERLSVIMEYLAFPIEP